MKRFQSLYENYMPVLIRETPPELHYHNPNHTQYVIDRVDLIAAQEGVSPEELELIKVAALFHDMGFLYQRKNHEEKGCEIVEKVLPERGFSQEEIAAVKGMIMATKIPQQPRNKLERVIADADLEYLGTDDFENGSSRLFHEVQHFHPEVDEARWMEIQIDFISQHQYHTHFCKVYREPLKQAHLRNLLEKVNL
jgi:uncharacterized protein